MKAPDNEQITHGTEYIAPGQWTIISDRRIARGTDFRAKVPGQKVILYIKMSAIHRREFIQFLGRVGRHGDDAEYYIHRGTPQLDEDAHTQYQQGIRGQMWELRKLNQLKRQPSQSSKTEQPTRPAKKVSIKEPHGQNTNSEQVTKPSEAH